MNNGGKILVRYVKGWVFFGLLKTVFTFSQGQWWSCFYRPLGAQWAFEFPHLPFLQTTGHTVSTKVYFDGEHADCRNKSNNSFLSLAPMMCNSVMVSSAWLECIACVFSSSDLVIQLVDWVVQCFGFFVSHWSNRPLNTMVWLKLWNLLKSKPGRVKSSSPTVHCNSDCAWTKKVFQLPFYLSNWEGDGP